MLELAPEGFEERERGHELELAAYTDGLGGSRIARAFGAAQEDDVPEDWDERWRTFHRPARVRPVLDRPAVGAAAADDAVAIVIDPGLAPSARARTRRRGSASSCWPSCALGSLLDVGLRLRRARDRRGEARLRAGARRRRRPVCDRDGPVERGSERRRHRRLAARCHARRPARRPTSRSRTSRWRLVESLAARVDARELIVVRLPRSRLAATRVVRRTSSAERSTDGPRTARHAACRGCIRSRRGDVHRPLSRLQGVARRRAGRARAAARATVTMRSTAGQTSRWSTPAASRTKPSRKSRKAAARAARTHSRVYVTGCGANLAGDAFAGLPPNVVVVARTSEETPAVVAGDVGALGCVQADARLDRVRAFVKIQDGCSFSCNFCVIPLVRGGTRSRSADAVLGEIRRRVAQGHREVVLTGINLGCYRDREAGYDLARLVREAGADARPGAPAPLVDRGQPRRRALDRALRETPNGRAPSARAAPVGRRRRAPGDGAALHGRRRICAGSSASPTSTSRPM